MDEAREEFIAPVVLTAHPLSDATMSRSRRLHPPVPRGIECRPGESDADFIARIVATCGHPDPELADDSRPLLPPVLGSR